MYDRFKEHLMALFRVSLAKGRWHNTQQKGICPGIGHQSSHISVTRKPSYSAHDTKMK